MNKATKKIILKTRKQVFGEMLGNNASLFQGQGFEFTELREYIYGDDIRKIDWKTTAKLGKPYVKIYREERELNVVVATMMNGSVYFGTVRQKSDVIAEIVSILGFSAVKNSDLFSYMTYADRLYERSKPSKKIFAVNKAVESLADFNAIGKVGDFKGFVDTLFNRVKKRSLLFVISERQMPKRRRTQSILGEEFHNLRFPIVGELRVVHVAEPMFDILPPPPRTVDSRARA